MGRPGRKRKDAPRKNGRIRYEEHRDYGTPEIQARRLWLSNGKDMALASYPLGILLANEVIDEGMHDAGCRFAWLHAMIYGKVSITAQKFDPGAVGRPTSEPDEEWLRKRRADWDYASATLKTLSRQHYDLVVSVAIYDRVPGFLKPKLQTMKDVREGGLLVAALGELANEMGYNRRVA